jgi:hypothetical protein
MLIVLLFYCFIVLLFYCFIVLLFYCFIVFLGTLSITLGGLSAGKEIFTLLP